MSKTERIEFFQSQSSFGSNSSLSNSRVVDLVEQLNEESQTIFMSLQNILYPRKDLVSGEELLHVVHRAKILNKQTIPSFSERVPEGENKDSVKKIQENQQKLTKFLNDYEIMQKDEMKYQEFYNLYGRSGRQNGFKKKQRQIEIIDMQPEVFDVSQRTPKKSSIRGKKMLAANRVNFSHAKEIQQLKDQVHKLKKREKDLIREKQATVSSLKQESEERISNILAAYRDRRSQNLEITTLKSQLQKSQEKLKNELSEISKEREKIIQLENENEQIKRRNKILQDEVESHRRIQVFNNSRINDDQGMHSPRSEDGGRGISYMRMQKMVQNLTDEKNLLLNELNRERESLYRLRKHEQDNVQSELSSLKRTLEQKNKEVSELKKNLDEEKIKSIQYKDKYDDTIKLLNKLKQQQVVVREPSFQLYQSPRENPQPKDTKPNFKVEDFQSQQLEGEAYYELLSKEYRIRFRRSCLKQKQLLYKANGLEVGVISAFNPPNEIKLILHFTNCSENQQLNNIKLRVINSNDNQIQNETSSVENIREGEQVRTLVYFYGRNYPLGSSVLMCEYEYYNKKENVRLLLPTSILRMIEVKGRDGQFRSSKKISFRSERKITKDLNLYFGNALIKQNTYMCTFTHDHTSTKLLVDIFFMDAQMEIQYEHRAGEIKITEYIIKNIVYLFRREHHR